MYKFVIAEPIRESFEDSLGQCQNEHGTDIA